MVNRETLLQTNQLTLWRLYFVFRVLMIGILWTTQKHPIKIVYLQSLTKEIPIIIIVTEFR